ncbi:MAG: hypothetical protein EZS28_026102, partial [Streblomastix strix]
MARDPSISNNMLNVLRLYAIAKESIQKAVPLRKS